MGDILHALPAAGSLKLSFPDHRITWLADAVWSPLLVGNPNIDRLVTFERNRPATWLPARRELRSQHYRFAIDFQGLIKSALAARLSGASKIFGFARSEVREALASSFYTDPISSASIHRVDRGLDLAVAAGAAVLTRESMLPPGIPEGELPDTRFVLASPFAGWGSKQWPLEFFDALGAILQREAGLPLVLNAAPSGRDALAHLRHGRPHFSGIAGLIDATRRATAVIGVDSGPLHLAAALRRPGVAIFGPTDPAINGPYGGSLTVLRAGGAETTYKRLDTIAGSMREITPGMVWTALSKTL